MKTLKLTLFTSVVTLTLFILCIYSCKKDERDSGVSIFCNDHASLVNGTCKCLDGYGGVNCELEKCGNAFCAAGKICVNGACRCPEGTYGNNCEFRTTDIMGVWIVLEKGSLSNTAQYSIAISIKTGDSASFSIQNYNNRIADKVTAMFSGDSLIIPQQTLDGRWQVVGTGIVVPDSLGSSHAKISMRYKIKDLSQPASAPADDFGYDGQGSASIWNK